MVNIGEAEKIPAEKRELVFRPKEEETPVDRPKSAKSGKSVSIHASMT